MAQRRKVDSEKTRDRSYEVKALDEKASEVLAGGAWKPFRRPDSLRGNVLAQGIWDEVWENDPGVLRPQDCAGVERYAVTLALWQMSAERVMGSGELTVDGPRGVVMLNPLVKLLADTARQLLPLEDRFGLNPDSRVRLGLGRAEIIEKASKLFGDDLDLDE